MLELFSSHLIRLYTYYTHTSMYIIAHMYISSYWYLCAYGLLYINMLNEEWKSLYSVIVNIRADWTLYLVYDNQSSRKA